jgi:cysteine synthase A
MNLKQKLLNLSEMIGNTPVVQLNFSGVNLYAKIEYFNMMGSIKDRPAYYILKRAIEKGKINQDTTVIESSSGNFGIALATICKKLGLKFIPVIDEMITENKEKTLRLLSYDVIKVVDRWIYWSMLTPLKPNL